MKPFNKKIRNLTLVLVLLMPIYPNLKLFGEQTIENIEVLTKREQAKVEIDNYTKLSDNKLNNAEFDKAEKFIINAIEISKDIFGNENLTTLNLLDKLGIIYSWQGKYKESEAILLRTSKNKKKLLGNENLEYINSKRALARLYDSLGRFKEAESLYKQNLKILNKVYGNKHPLYLAENILLGALYSKYAFHEKGLNKIYNSCQISKKYRDQYSWAIGNFYSSCLGRLSNIYMNMGNAKEAEKVLNESLKIDIKNYGKESIEVAKKLATISRIYLRQDNFIKAEESILESIKITEKLLGKEHFLLARRLIKLGEIYQMQNLFNKAEKFYLRSLKIAEKVYGKKHPNYAYYLGQLGNHYSQYSDIENKNFQKAENYLLSSLKIYNKKYGEIHPRTLKEKQSLGYLYLLKAYNSEFNETEDTSELYEQAEILLSNISEIARENLPIDHVINTNSLYMLGDLYLAKGDFEKAENLFIKSLNKTDKFFGIESINTAIALNKLAEVYAIQGSYEKAKPLFKKQLIISLNLIKKELPFLPLDERTKFIDYFHYNFTKLNSFFVSDEISNDLPLLMRFNRQGLLAEIEKNQSRLANLSGKNKKLVEDLMLITNQLSSKNNNNKNPRNLLIKKKNLEKKLYKVLPKLKPKIVQIDEVYKRIPDNGILIEFQKYRPYENKEVYAKAYERINYLASIIDSKGTIKNIDLGEAKRIDELIKKGLKASEESLSDTQDIMDEISAKLINPIQNQIINSEIIIISPDHELNRIPFATLRSPKSTNFLNEDYELRLVTTGRELIEIEIENNNKNKRGPLIIANPNFNLSKIKKLGSNLKTYNSQIRSKDVDSKNWNMLPGTEKEGIAIAEITNGTLMQGDEATSLNIQNANKPKILHVASHSYYSNDSETYKIDSINKLNIENPLIKSGIVLAGANNPSDFDDDDGYLTALEITKLDWEGTDLVVVSGCQSGLGELRSGEGVYGLKRAIAVAGAKSSLLSLWKVNDIATADFMESFYLKLKKGYSKSKALAKTQKEFRNHSIPGYRHPHVWAAFQLSGDWRPIDF